MIPLPAAGYLGHVAIVVPTAYPDGLAEARGVGRALAGAGLRTTVVCSRISRRQERDLEEPSVVEAASRMRGIIDAMRFSRAAALVLRRLRPDLAHVYAYRGCALLPRLAPGPRYLYDLRTGNVSGRAWAFLADRVSCWEAIPYHARAIISRAVERHVCGNHWGDALVLPLGFPSRDAAMARGVVERRRRASPDGVVRVGFVGALHPQRRLDRILLVAKALRDRGCACEWIVVGDGPDRRRLEGLAGTMELTSVVQFRGAVPNDEVWSQYAAMDVCFAYVPAVRRYYYQPPLKTVEAMACGLPVVATDTVGNREYIEPGRDGVLVVDATEPLARAVEGLVRDPGERIRLGTAASERAKPYAWERIVEETVLPAYARMLGTNG